MSDAYVKAVVYYAGIGFILGLPVSAVLNHFLPTDGLSLGRGILLLLITMVVTIVVSIPAIGRKAEQISAQEVARSHAMPITGTVIDVQQTSTSKRGEWIYVTVTLDVPLPGGQQKVQADSWRIKAIDVPRLQVAQPVPVKVDPQQPQFVFPDCDWIEML
jgi:hypothetical protein